ncbi:MAG: helicase-exonuclease AddAB subunit AddA [Lachnospiraceae bacterium]|nr:helicase-exonuclease AddAB subunit AddA [Lachnospiraceae bacterium]
MGKTGWTADQKKVIELRDRNILVSAAAGSGKTAVLVERIIDIISNKEKPVDIDRLLVVTFTRAAAAEMKGRVLEALEDKLVENPDDEHIQRQVTLLHNSQITTIDSFCQSIIRNYFYVIDLDPSFKVADENDLSIIKNEILEKLIEEKYSQTGEEYEAFVAFADVMSPGRTDSNIEELVLKLFDISMSYPWPMEWLKSCGDMYKCKSVEELEESSWMKELVSYTHEMVEVYLSMAQEVLEKCNESDGPGQYKEAVESDISQIKEMVNASTYSEQFEAFYRYNPARLPAKKDASVDPEKREEAKAIRDKYKKSIENLKESFFFQSPDEMLKDIKIMSPVIQQLVNLTIEFADVFAQKKRDDGILDFSDMEHFALDILVTKDGNKVLPSSVAKELQEYYEEIMTDEYQDSNFVQELILTSISRGPESKPYLFMVGDVKQSIYQFRLARPELFMNKYNTYSTEESKCQRIDLKQNFRSRKIVLDSANFIFRNIMQKCVGGIEYDDAASLVPGKKYDECEYKISDSTDVIVIEQKSEDDETIEKRTLEAAAIGNKIKEMVQGEDPLYVSGKSGYHRAEYRDIVILLRSVSGWSEEFIETLTDMGIPAYSDTKTGYFSSLEVATILDLLRIIDNPRQDIPLAAVLRSVLGGFSDEEMACIGILPRTLNYWDCLMLILKYGQECEEDMSVYWDMLPLDEEGIKNLHDKTEKFCSMIDKYHKQSLTLSVYELLQRIYKETGYYDIMSAMPAGEKRAANLDILLQQSLEFAENGHQGIFAFTHYIESLRKSNIDFGEASVTGENTNAVRIMSIHKSKGLQFPIVFVAGMGKKFNLTDARKSTIIDADYGIGADFIDLESRIKQPTLIKKFLANQIKRNTYAEEIRILYVALTRAEEKLIITGTAANTEKKMEGWLNKSRRIDMEMLLGAQTYFDWIIPAVLSEREDGKLFNLSVISKNDIVGEEMDSLRESMDSMTQLLEWDCDKIYDKDMYDEIHQSKSYQYPYEAMQNLPVKISVSELKRMSMQKVKKLSEDYIDEPEYMEEKVYEAPRPSFMKEKEVATGAEKGTLYHLVMEHLPYEDIDEDYDFRELINSLVQKGYMSDEEAGLLDTGRFEWFSKNKLFERMKNASLNGKLKREQPFMLGIPAAELYPELDDSCDEIVMMQGIIDAFFEEDGKLVLVDYKTDYIEKGKEDELVKRYESQLNYYARALESITGKEVSEKIIYSFGLGKCVRI